MSKTSEKTLHVHAAVAMTCLVGSQTAFALHPWPWWGEWVALGLCWATVAAWWVGAVVRPGS